MNRRRSSTIWDSFQGMTAFSRKGRKCYPCLRYEVLPLCQEAHSKCSRLLTSRFIGLVGTFRKSLSGAALFLPRRATTFAIADSILSTKGIFCGKYNAVLHQSIPDQFCRSVRHGSNHRSTGEEAGNLRITIQTPHKETCWQLRND